MKRPCSLSVDRISEVPCHIKQTILMSLSLHDMARTSILARNWRFQWTKVPQLIFDRRKRYSARRVFGILLQHQGTIIKFTLSTTDWQHDDIDKIISYLARNGIQELEMYSDGRNYKVPSSIFSCVELKCLRLTSCLFRPITFDGFNKLITLELMHVKLDSHVFISSCPSLESLTMVIDTRTILAHFSVDAPKLKILYFEGEISCIGFMNTPLLKFLSFTENDEALNEEFTIGLMNFLCSLPHLESLVLYYTFVKLLAFGVSPNKLPTVLNNLRKLEIIYVTLTFEEELSSTLWLIRNSPNLIKLKLEKPFSGSKFGDGWRKLDYSDHYLTKLQEVEVFFIDVPYHMTAQIEFLMYLLDVSPVLEKLYFRHSQPPSEGQSKVMLDLACYRRASPKAEIVFKLELQEELVNV